MSKLASPPFVAAAKPFAAITLESINSTDPRSSSPASVAHLAGPG